MKLRALRRDRAARTGPQLFLFERVFEDCLERIALVGRRFDRALLLGCPDPGWPASMRDVADRVQVADVGKLFAQSAGGDQLIEDAWDPPKARFDLILAVGTLDTVNELPRLLSSLRHAMQADGLFIGAFSGGDALPRLRSAMRAADEVAGAATPHVHPRIEPSAVAPLLSAAGFVMPVVDIDRVQVSYRSLARLIADLRAMGATNILEARPRQSLSKAALRAAEADFALAGDGTRTIETFEIVHFAAWTPAGAKSRLSGR